MKDKKAITTYVFTCAECGKRFEISVPSDYIYKIKKKKDNMTVIHDWFCSRGCMNKFKARKGKFDLANKIDKDIEEDNKQEEIREARIELELMKRMKEWNEK